MAEKGWLARLGKVLSPLLTAKAVVETTRTVQQKADEYIDKKRDEFVKETRSEAERFMVDQIAKIEAKVDIKIIEIERKIDEQIEKEIRSKLRILIYTLITVIVMSLISLTYLYLKNRLSL
ncbi:hypothetical protein JYT87_03755 [Nitrospira defluvii]|nr:hypothetical protein [Nitrospira defluvii]